MREDYCISDDKLISMFNQGYSKAGLIKAVMTTDKIDKENATKKVEIILLENQGGHYKCV